MPSTACARNSSTMAGASRSLCGYSRSDTEPAAKGCTQPRLSRRVVVDDADVRDRVHACDSGHVIQDRLDMSGRVVMVAGAGGGGIGTAICRVLADTGAAVIALDIDPARLDVAPQAGKEAGGRRCAIVADVRDAVAVERAVGDGAARLGGLDGLVHVAGGLAYGQW